MGKEINLREYFFVGRDVLRSCWLWLGPYFNGVPWFHGESARRLVRDRYGHKIDSGAHLASCLLGDKRCVNPAHTYAFSDDLEHLYKYILPASEPDGCRLWTGCTLDGYPLITIDGKTRRVGRVLWELVRGSIPDGLYVLHRCDEPLCTNIGESGDDGHLWLGTAADNSADMIAKGRAAWQKRGKSKGALSDG